MRKRIIVLNSQIYNEIELYNEYPKILMLTFPALKNKNKINVNQGCQIHELKTEDFSMKTSQRRTKGRTGAKKEDM